jgi:cyclopropane fatty-acyl-phospholipid synthase-like methyltransferase
MDAPYDLIAERWHAERAPVFREKPYLDRIIQQLEPAARILDLGCGAGQPIARYLAHHGFKVTGVDQSHNMLQIAKRVVPAIQLIHADMLEVEFRVPFAAVIAWDSIFHIDHSQHTAVFRKVQRWLRPGGWFLLSAGGSGAAGFTSEMFGHTFFYSGFAPEETVRLLAAQGFHIRLQEVDDPSSRGHVAILAQKSG